MNRKRRLTLKYLLLISVLMLMMLLCACRVRLTNNTEVASTIEDDDGWLKDSYQMRRDQLGEPVAERPIFKGLESDDEEDYSDLDYEPLDYDQGTLDEWEEPEDTPSSSSSSSSGSSSGSGSGSSSGSGSGSGSGSSEDEEEKKPEEPKPDPVTEIIVEFDTKGGRFDIAPYNERPYIKVVTGSTFGELPTPVNDDKNQFFIGWFTDEDKLITKDSTVESEEPLTLYAHWGKDYAFTLKTDGGRIEGKTGDGQGKSDKGLYQGLPKPEKEGYHFMGWYLENDKAQVDNGQECKSDQSLVAHWLENAKYWEKVYNDTNPADENKVLFITDDINTTGKLVRGTPWDASTSPDSSPAFVIIKLADGTYSPDAAKSAAEQKRAKLKEEDPEKYEKYFKNSKIIVIPKNATDGNNELYYKLVLHNAMYGGIEGLDSAAAETGTSISDYAVDPDKAAPAQ